MSAASDQKPTDVRIVRGEHGILVREEVGFGRDSGGASARFWAFSTPAEAATWLLANFGGDK